MTAKEQLYEKLSAEYAAFIDGLKSASPDEIIDSAYEKVFKKDILSCFEYGDSFSEKQIAAMLALDYPLDALYRNWLDTDVSYMDDLSDTISSFATREAQEQTGIDGVEVAEAVEIAAPLNAETRATQAINGELNIGDYVIVVPNDDYGYLVGQVKAIDKLGTPEHDTENPGDDIHVDFTVFSYPPWQQNDFAEHFNDLFDYDEYKSFTDLPLDDVIIAPDAIISLTGISDERINDFITDPDAAERFCNQILQDFDVNREEQLTQRIEKNLTDYKSALLSFGNREIIDMARKIAAMQDVYDYMTTTRGFSDEELRFYLQFQNPLEVVADAWLERNADNEDLSFSMDYTFERSGELLKAYPLMSDIDAFADDPIHHRYMGVDLIDFLGKIAGKVIIHNPEDWQSHSNALYRLADTENPEHKRLMWSVSSRGAQMFSERDTFVQETPAFDKCVDYRSYDPNMFGYVVEITGRNGNAVTGNVFEVGHYADFANHVRLTALPLESITLKYSNDKGENAGKTITVPRSEYDNERQLLASANGKVTSIQYNPSESVREMSSLLRDEHSRRMAWPIGSTETHLKKLTETIADARDTSATSDIEFVSRETKQAYNMGAAEFEKLMYGLLPDASLTAMMNWKGYASDLQVNGTHTKAEFFLELFIEFDLVKQHYGEKIAMKLFDYAEHFTLNPFEVRGAANHLRDGKHISEIENLYVEGELDRTSQEWNESEQATRAFLSNEGKYKRPEKTGIAPKTEHEQTVQSSPEKLPADKKLSIGDRIAAGNEKVRAYKEQKAQTPDTTTPKHKKEDVLE